MEKFAGQPIDTLADSRRCILSQLIISILTNTGNLIIIHHNHHPGDCYDERNVQIKAWRHLFCGRLVNNRVGRLPCDPPFMIHHHVIIIIIAIMVLICWSSAISLSFMIHHHHRLCHHHHYAIWISSSLILPSSSPSILSSSAYAKRKTQKHHHHQ